MKRFVCVLLCLMMVCGMVTAVADGLYITDYKERMAVSYSWETGEATAWSRSWQVQFVNVARRDITGCQLLLEFLDADGSSLGTAESEMEDCTVKAGETGWSPSVKGL